jgi:hypothetical protein
VEGEQVAAGWPPWLVAVAAEAVRGWVPRRAESFEKLDKVTHALLVSCLLASLFLLVLALVSAASAHRSSKKKYYSY